MQEVLSRDERGSCKILISQYR